MEDRDWEAEIDRMMAAAADRDLAEPWQAVKQAMGQLPTEHQAEFMEQLHYALMAQGHDPNDRAYI